MKKPDSQVILICIELLLLDELTKHKAAKEEDLKKIDEMLKQLSAVLC